MGERVSRCLADSKGKGTCGKGVLFGKTLRSNHPARVTLLLITLRALIAPRMAFVYDEAGDKSKLS